MTREDRHAGIIRRIDHIHPKPQDSGEKPDITRQITGGQTGLSACFSHFRILLHEKTLALPPMICKQALAAAQKIGIFPSVRN
jgi:hypothetical protein